MNGIVDEQGRALLTIELRSVPTAAPVEIASWVDTGFTGELVLPQSTIDAVGLVHSGSVDAILADGSQLELETFTCFIEWFGSLQQLEVVANQGEFPLLGVGLLLGTELHISYKSGELQII